MHIKMFTTERIDSHPRSSVNIPLRGMDCPVPPRARRCISAGGGCEVNVSKGSSNAETREIACVLFSHFKTKAERHRGLHVEGWTVGKA